jgi:hypothetical protein
MDAAAIFEKYSSPIAALGYATRAFVLQHLPGATEEVDVPGNLLGYGYGPGYKNMVCTIIASKSMMKIGLYKGTELPDPAGLLKGTGKLHKYIEIKTEADLQNPAVAALVAEGLKAYKTRATK